MWLRDYLVVLMWCCVPVNLFVNVFVCMCVGVLCVWLSDWRACLYGLLARVRVCVFGCVCIC